MKKKFTLLLVLMLALFVVGCSENKSEQSEKDEPTNQEEPKDKANEEVFKIGAIPDFNASELTRAFDDFADYLSTETGFKVEYVPTVDYASLVASFERGEIDMAWFGGLTGVQAMSSVEGAEALAQRPQDAEFKSVFIKNASVTDVKALADLKGHSFSFGSESSTSGHLMPRYFMTEEGLDPDKDLDGEPNYSGSHDKTFKLVESGAFQTGAVNMQYWDQAVEEGKVDLSKIEEFYRTPDYFDYNWTINNVDKKFGEGTKDKFKSVLLKVKPEDSEMMNLLSTDKFIETKNENYDKIKEVAKQLEIIK